MSANTRAFGGKIKRGLRYRPLPTATRKPRAAVPVKYYSKERAKSQI